MLSEPLLTTLTRQIRRRGGEVVLANLSRGVRDFVDEMQMDAFWDVFDDVDEARAFLDRGR